MIHGGSCWRTYSEYIKDWEQVPFRPDFSPKAGWQRSLPAVLGPRFKVVLADMPNWQNAKYKEWKIWFEKALAFAGKKPVVIGHSLGGIFLAKYFSETAGHPEIRRLILVGAPFKVLPADRDFGDFVLNNSLGALKNWGNKVCLFHSQDDPIVDFADFQKYRAALPAAVGKSFRSRGHFLQNRFPGLVREITAAFLSRAEHERR